eukprot:scaffold7820_cov363-Prasinococcus_capsulatus_cf.AAC.1
MPLSYHAQHTLRERATRGCSKDEVPANLQALVAPHIESYNWFIEQVRPTPRSAHLNPVPRPPGEATCGWCLLLTRAARGTRATAM